MEDTIREIRLMVEWRNTLLRICKVAFTRSDASIYFFPYGPNGRYYYGSKTMKEHEISQTFDFKKQLASNNIPKLSIHQSGRVHVGAPGNELAGPVYTLPLASFRGEHIATVTVDHFRNLIEHTGPIQNADAVRDLITPVEAGVNSGRFAFYVNGHTREFASTCPIHIEMRRPKLCSPIYIGIVPVGQESISEDKVKSGVTIIAGWSPQSSLIEKQDYIYIRAE